MVSNVKDQDRIIKTRQKLNQLKLRGYDYIVADENGDVWTGDKKSGLNIDELLDSPFLGEIQIEAR